MLDIINASSVSLNQASLKSQISNVKYEMKMSVFYERSGFDSFFLKYNTNTLRDPSVIRMLLFKHAVQDRVLVM